MAGDDASPSQQSSASQASSASRLSPSQHGNPPSNTSTTLSQKESPPTNATSIQQTSTQQTKKSPVASHQDQKSTCGPPTLKDLKGFLPSGTAQQQALLQQALHQQALHEALQQHALQATFHSAQQHQGRQGHKSGHGHHLHSQGSQQALTYHSPVKVESADNDGVLGRNKTSMLGTENHVDVAYNGGKPSSSPPQLFEASKEDNSSTHALGSGRMAREGMFTDLNAEPPASDEEEEGILISTSSKTIGQEPTTRTEGKNNITMAKEVVASKDPEADGKRSSKPGKPRPKPKGEPPQESTQDGDVDYHSDLTPSRDEKIKSLKAGLIHVARKLPKNAHAHFVLGLMQQRLGQPAKAIVAFEKAADILKQSEEETGQGRAQLLALVQKHHAQCILQGNITIHTSVGKDLQKDEIEGVITKLKEITIGDQGQASIWNTLGLLFLRTGRIQSAAFIFTSLLSIVPDNLDALGNLGVAYLHSGDLGYAERCFQSVLSKDVNHPGALVNYAALLLRKYGSYLAGAGAGAAQEAYAQQLIAAVAAQQCLESALKEDPKASYVWANLATAFDILGDICSASICLGQASRLEPARLSIRYAIASHRVKDAERSDDPAEQLAWAANEMASILREGDPASLQARLAWAGLAMVIRAQHDTTAAFDSGVVDIKEVQERAVHTLQQAIEEDPDDALQWHQLGLHTLCTLQFVAAQKYFKCAIARRQTCAAAWTNLGIALQLSESISEAEKIYKQALSLVPSEHSYSILSNLGNLYRQQKRYNDAETALNRALELCSNYAPACNNLGLVYIAQGRWNDAIEMFDRAFEADPYLDVAKSNKMKAVALSQRQKSSSPQIRMEAK